MEASEPCVTQRLLTESRRHHRPTLRSGIRTTSSGEANKKVCVCVRVYVCVMSWGLNPCYLPPSTPGLVGISLTADWGEPVDVTNQRDIEAAERYLQFYLGWFAAPVFHGDYPQVMKDYIGGSQLQD